MRLGCGATRAHGDAEYTEQRQGTNRRFHCSDGAVSCRRGLADDAIILGMRADPKPQHSIFNIDRQRPVVGTDAHRETAPPLKWSEG